MGARLLEREFTTGARRLAAKTGRRPMVLRRLSGRLTGSLSSEEPSTQSMRRLNVTLAQDDEFLWTESDAVNAVLG